MPKLHLDAAFAGISIGLLLVLVAMSCGKHAPDQVVTGCAIDLAEGPHCSALVQRNYGILATSCSDGQEHLYPVNAKLNCRKE